MVVDAVLANDEWDLIVFRLKYLSPVVDTFYIGESAVTFSGLSKELFFEKRKRQLEALGVAVETFRIDIPEEILQRSERWAVETYARNTFLEYVCERHRDDLVLFADVDEVPSLQQVHDLIARGDSLSIMSIPTQVCLRKANWIEYWPNQWKGKWGNGLLGRDWVPRIRRGRYPLVPGEPGAHFSYVGMDETGIKRKYQAFSHGELDRDELSSQEFLEFANTFHISHIGRALEPGAGLLTVVSMENLTGLQREALALYPAWFDFEPVSQPRHRRLVASWILFMKIRGTLRGSLEDAFAPVVTWTWLRHAVAYALVWCGWKLFTVLGLNRMKRPAASPA